jgi:hypothetical protein
MLMPLLILLCLSTDQKSFSAVPVNTGMAAVFQKVLFPAWTGK